METRASHIVVGGFVLLLLAGMIGFIIWIAKVDLDAEYKDYDVYFDNSVFGLYKRSVVYYQGIPVGEVRDITLAPKDPGKVKVWLRLNSDVPVVRGATARLEFQGLTGVAFIELLGGSPGSPQIVAVGDQDRPVIPSTASNFQAIFQNAPNLVNEAIMTVVKVQKILSDENIQKISAILDNSEQISANLAKGTNDLDALMADGRAVMQEVTLAAAELKQVAATGRALLDEDARVLLSETTATMTKAHELMTRVDNLVAANDGEITQFVTGSLPEISRMIMDLRISARNLSKLVSRLEKNPVDVILGPGETEYNLKSRKREGGN